MSEEQKLVLDEYLEAYGKPSLREMSKDSGIQLTRLFRIMNGMEMRLEEYLILKKRIQAKMELGCLNDLAFKCEACLPLRAKKELDEMMKRLLKQQRIKNLKLDFIQAA